MFFSFLKKFKEKFIVIGGCGAMFEINVVAPEFKGLNTIKQHRLINEVRKF